MRKFPILILLTLSYITHAQKQGVQGQVFWLSGNLMPGPGKGASPQQGIVREVFIYNAANQKDNPSEDGFFKEINSTFVQKTTSAPDGSFKVKLPPGRYSVFVKEEKGLFANLFSSDGCINCITVRPKKYAWVTITVDYEAAY